MRLRTAAAGAFAFIVCALLPTLHRAERMGAFAFVLLVVPPLCLALGLVLAARPGRAAPYVLLTGFPLSLALSLSRFEHDLALATFSPLVLGFSCASLAVYAASAAALCAEPATSRAVEHKPLGEVAAVEPETRKQTFGHLVLALVTVGALWLAFAGSSGSPAELREAWGRAAPEGATLTALVAGLIGASAVALVAPALRADRTKKRTPDDLKRRLSWLALVAISGLSVYALVRLTGL